MNQFGKGFRLDGVNGVLGGHKSYKVIGCNKKEATECKFFKIHDHIFIMSSKDLTLSVGGGNICEGAEIHFWKHKLDFKCQWWVLNSDHTLSPETNTNLVIGWLGDGISPVLVDRMSEMKA
jgi:hypothetical protein